MEREIFHPNQRPPTMLQERNQQNNRDGWFHFQGNLIHFIESGMQIRYYKNRKKYESKERSGNKVLSHFQLSVDV